MKKIIFSLLAATQFNLQSIVSYTWLVNKSTGHQVLLVGDLNESALDNLSIRHVNLFIKLLPNLTSKTNCFIEANKEIFDKITSGASLGPLYCSVKSINFLMLFANDDNNKWLNIIPADPRGKESMYLNGLINTFNNKLIATNLNDNDLIELDLPEIESPEFLSLERYLNSNKQMSDVLKCWADSHKSKQQLFNIFSKFQKKLTENIDQISKMLINYPKEKRMQIAIAEMLFKDKTFGQAKQAFYKFTKHIGRSDNLFANTALLQLALSNNFDSKTIFVVADNNAINLKEWLLKLGYQINKSQTIRRQISPNNSAVIMDPSFTESFTEDITAFFKAPKILVAEENKLQNREITRQCAKCDKHEEPGKKHKACSQCKKALYCCKECQKADWAQHKKTCVAVAVANGAGPGAGVKVKQ